MEGRQCTATSKQSGERCRRAPIKGGTVCKIHGGGSSRVQAAADRRLAEVEMQDAVKTLGLPVDIDPAKALLDEIHWCAGHVAWLRGKVQEISDADLVWGASDHQHGYNDKGGVDMKTDKAGPNAWLELYNQERDRFHRVCALALRSGIEERRVKLAEQQGDLVAAVVNRILNRLNLTPAQWSEVPVIVPEEFRAIAAMA
jgi:hypothetical protein